MEKETIIAMAIAVIAENSGIEPKHVAIRSYKEIHKSSLQQYIEDNHIEYHKYQLEGYIK